MRYFFYWFLQPTRLILSVYTNHELVAIIMTGYIKYNTKSGQTRLYFYNENQQDTLFSSNILLKVKMKHLKSVILVCLITFRLLTLIEKD